MSLASNGIGYVHGGVVGSSCWKWETGASCGISISGRKGRRKRRGCWDGVIGARDDCAARLEEIMALLQLSVWWSHWWEWSHRCTAKYVVAGVEVKVEAGIRQALLSVRRNGMWREDKMDLWVSGWLLWLLVWCWEAGRSDAQCLGDTHHKYCGEDRNLYVGEVVLVLSGWSH